MTRLMLVTFAMLGWLFYVMSGGPDFEPRGIRANAPAELAQSEGPAAKPLVPAPAEDLVNKVALHPKKPIEPRVEPTPVAATPDADAILEQVAASLNPGIPGFDTQGATFSLASLDDNVALPPQTATSEPVAAADPTPAEPPKDIRIVSGTRVNMRDGPGTIYPIVGKARMGQKVEVLSDSGTGWLRLRVLPEQQIGWISTSLIRKTQN